MPSNSNSQEEIKAHQQQISRVEQRIMTIHHHHHQQQQHHHHANTKQMSTKSDLSKSASLKFKDTVHTTTATTTTTTTRQQQQDVVQEWKPSDILNDLLQKEQNKEKRRIENEMLEYQSKLPSIVS